ncbi:hypothetical protein F5Y14DRAFT_458353 [Nemania sp. NC0429]|nr:hypothetical protein F5Y14DRAFT_458353 [Nemania sp. NC0429]
MNSSGMDSSGMDFAMQQFNHYYYQREGDSSSASASRCPGLRAAAEQRNYQLPAGSSTGGSMQYDPVHGHPIRRDHRPSRNPPNWRPAMIASPFAQETMAMGAFPGQTPPNQSSPQPPCPMSNASGPSGISDPYTLPPFPAFRPTMHPAPRLGQPTYRLGSNPSQSNTQHPSNRPMQGTNNGLHAPNSTHSVPSPQVLASRNSPAPVHMGLMSSLGPENNTPSQQLPNLLPHIYPQQNPSSFSPQTQAPESIVHAASPADEDSGRPTSHSHAASTSAATQRTDDQPNRIISPVDIRRVAAASMRRPNMPRMAGTSDWMGEGGFLFRRADMSLVEFVENFPSAIPDGETTPMTGRFLRGHGSVKRVASKKALASLQSVDIADLPESERTCVICYNDFGVANPEGINEAPLRLPKCKHVFGDHCIKKWFQESDSCPYCRDKVHSELQPMHIRRNHPGFRAYLTAQGHLPYYQGLGHSHPRDRDAMESEAALQPGQSMANNSTDRRSSQLSDAGPSNRPSSGNRRFENNHHHSTRTSSWNSYERRSPPAEYDRRRRPRQRMRLSPPSTRPSLFGGPTSNSTSQNSVRPSRSSRSRSPFDPSNTGLDSGSRRSLTNGPEQYLWNSNSTPNPNQTGATTASSTPNGQAFAPTFPLQPQMNMPSDDYFHGLVPLNPDVMPTNEHPSELPQIRSDPGRFSSPDIYVSRSSHGGSDQFTSYQQS